MSASGKIKPKLLALLICERVMLEEDKVISLIRVVDTFNARIELLPDGRPERVGGIIECVVYTKWGLAEGEFTEELRVLAPNGKESPQIGSVRFTLSSGLNLYQIRHFVRLAVKQSGKYAFRIYLDGELMGEHPFIFNLEKVAPQMRQT